MIPKVPRLLTENSSRYEVWSECRCCVLAECCLFCAMVFLALLLLPTVAAFYSIHYSAKSNHPAVIGQTHFVNTPSATQVADIYARVAGKAPLLSEAQGVLPSVDILQKSNGQPIILHLIGGGNFPVIIGAYRMCRGSIHIGAINCHS